MIEITDKIDCFLNERTKTTKVQMVKTRRELKKEKSRDTSVELYDDLVRFLSTYLNTMDTKDLVKYKVMNRKKAIEMVEGMASSTPEAQAMLTKIHLDPEKLVARFWTLKDMKTVIEDTVNMLLKGTKPDEITAAAAPIKEEADTTKKCTQCGKVEKHTVQKTGPAAAIPNSTIHKCAGCGHLTKIKK